MAESRDKQELVNALTHGVGAFAAAGGGAILVTMASLKGDPWKIVGAAVFTAALLFLYVASALYHAVHSPGRKARLRVLDHAAIYVLIAGTYTPFTLAGLRGGWGWSLFGVIWGLAVAGVLFKLFATGRFPRLSTGIYVAMGWLILVAAGPLVRALPPSVVGWLVAGGIAYTGGTFFYANKRLPYSHAVWHGFVLVGSACHAIAVGLQI